jgi:putative phosphoribosyl transferase
MENTAGREVAIPIDAIVLPGSLAVPQGARGIALFAHGSGSSRLSPRNNYVAAVLRAAGIGTLLFDLLTEQEDRLYPTRFDVDLLTERLSKATEWLASQPEAAHLPLGYFGASTGAAAALNAAAELGSRISAVVSRGGRPDLAGDNLRRVQAATLLIVGGNDQPVLALNQDAYELLPLTKRIDIVPGATHLFDEPETLDQVARLAAEWFNQFLVQAG